MLVVATALAGCGSSGSTAKNPGTVAPKNTSRPSGSKESSTGKTVDPCALVTIEQIATLLGGPAAAPERSTHATGSRSCLWKLQSSVDDPGSARPGHMLTLTVQVPPAKSMTPTQYFESAKNVAMEKADVCQESFWLSGQLMALQDGVYLGAVAGIADSSPEAKKVLTTLMTEACASLG